MGSISRHISPLVINSLGGGHTHKHTNSHTNTHTDVRTGTISRNQGAPAAGQRVHGLIKWFEQHLVNQINFALGKNGDYTHNG